MCSLEGGSIVCTITSDGDDLPQGAQLFNKNLLVFWGGTGKNLQSRYDLEHLCIVQLPKDRSFHNNAAGCKDPALGSNGTGSKDIITGAHFDSDTSFLAICNSLPNAVA
jgi:hypothetical protein